MFNKYPGQGDFLTKTAKKRPPVLLCFSKKQLPFFCLCCILISKVSIWAGSVRLSK